jgi:hypothetical protein
VLSIFFVLTDLCFFAYLQMFVDEEDEVQNENDLEMLEGNANDEIAP